MVGFFPGCRFSVKLQKDVESKNEFKSLIKEEISKAINENLPGSNGWRKDFEPDDKILRDSLFTLCYHRKRRASNPSGKTADIILKFATFFSLQNPIFTQKP